MTFRRHVAAFAALLFLGSCDEPHVISYVDRAPDLVLEDLWQLQDPRGIPVEVHGTPFRRISDQALVETLKMPAGGPQEVRFYVTQPGGTHPFRLVLHFNPQGAPNAARDCALTDEARTNAGPPDGYTMNAVFCASEVWKAHGHIEVLEIADGDMEKFADYFRTLMQAIFREEKDI